MEQHAASLLGLAGLDPLVQEMHAVVALHLASEPVRLIFRRAEKVARCNWRSNLPESHANTRSGHVAAQVEVEGKRAGTRPHENGFP